MSTEAQQLLAGAVDMHYHSAPSPFPRKMDLATVAQMYDQAGFRAAVMKSHHHSTVMEILALESTALKGLRTQFFGGIALNGAVGGLNPRAVDLALHMGGRVVWFPTMSSGAHIDFHRHNHDSPFPTSTIKLMPEEEIDVLDENGKLKPAVYDIIDIIKETDAVLSFGHMAAHQVDAVLGAAERAGVQRLLVTHPEFLTGISQEQARDYARRGVVIEHEVGMYNDEAPRGVRPLEELLGWIEAVGVGSTSLASDVGQRSNPTVVSTYLRVVDRLLESGVSANDIRTMVATNPGQLLGVN